MDKRLLTVVMAAVLVALIITAIFYQITVGRQLTAADVPTKTLVVARTDLPQATKLNAEDVAVVEIPVQWYPNGGFENIDDVIDRSVRHAILANEPIVEARVTQPGSDLGLTSSIPEGYRAIAVAVNQVTGVSGFVLPGSKVDILLSAIPRGYQERLTTTVLEDVTVLSTGHKQEPGAEGRPENVPVVNILLTPEDAELLTLATQEGQIRLVLRNPKDSQTTSGKRNPITVERLFGTVLPERAAPRRTAPPPSPATLDRAVLEPPEPQAFFVEVIQGNRREVIKVDRTEN